MRMDYGNGTALGYSVSAKAHAITIGVATTAFVGTLAVLPAAMAPIVQIPIRMAILFGPAWPLCAHGTPGHPF